MSLRTATKRPAAPHFDDDVSRDSPKRARKSEVGVTVAAALDERERDRRRSRSRDGDRRGVGGDRERDRDRGGGRDRDRGGERERDRGGERNGNGGRNVGRGRERDGESDRDQRERDNREGARGERGQRKDSGYVSPPLHSQRDRSRERRYHERKGHQNGKLSTPATTQAGSQANGDKDKMDVDDTMEREDHVVAEMKKLMGFSKFRSTKNTKVPGNDKLYAVRKEKKTEYRQYMNRVGGFNRPLSPSRS